MANCKFETDREGTANEESNELEIPADIETSQVVKRWADKGGELLPGILDDVTLFHIIPKLLWRDLHVLLSVSSGWQKSLQSQENLDRRVGSPSLETFVVVHQDSYTTGTLAVSELLPAVRGEFWLPERNLLAIYSIRDKYCYELPSFPFGTEIPYGSHIPYGSQYISCNCTIYVLGGAMDPELGWVSSQVYKLDLVGQHQWKPCASMIQPRIEFGVVALNGKIYVFGGIFKKKPVLGCEMYDPKLDAWFPIGPIPLCRYDHKVEIVGEELIVYGGQFITDVLAQIYDTTSAFRHFDDMRGLRDPSILINGDKVPFLDAYHPVKGEWRRINPSEVKDWNKMLVARERFYEITPEGLCVYDLDKDSWSLLHPFQDVSDRRYYKNTVVFDDELLLVYSKWKVREPRVGFFRSRGFGIKDRVPTWAEVDFPVSLNMIAFPHGMITTQL